MVAGLGVHDLGVRYGPVPAVDGVSISVAPGEVVAVLGPSGSGKSSLLRGIAGLESVSGDVTWDGESVLNTPVHKRGFVVMFQDGQLFPHFTVAGNVAYGIAGMPRPTRDDRVAELLGIVGLDGYGPRPTTALSGGQAQRVALARSLAPSPRLLLLDEPLSSLDRALREHLTAVLAATLRTTQTTAIYVTHDQDEAFAIADRVGVMMDGRLRQLATPADLWSRPADRQVAAFLGYGPFLTHDEAAALGTRLAPGTVLALGPQALVADESGTDMAVISARARRGGADATVRLPSGQEAVVRTTSAPRDGVRVRLDPSACAVLTDAD